MAIAAALAEMGREPAVISRGYGGSSKAPVTWAHDGRELLADAAAVGDEPVMVARELGLPVAVGADRWQVGREVLAKLGPRVLVADDLFQHRGLWRDLNLLALDAARPFGNGVVLPRGPLREPARALRRAQAVVLTRAEEPSAVEATRRWLAKFLGPIPVLACRHRVTGVVDHQGRWRPAGELAGRKVAAFAAWPGPIALRPPWPAWAWRWWRPGALTITMPLAPKRCARRGRRPRPPGPRPWSAAKGRGAPAGRGPGRGAHLGDPLGAAL